METQRILIMEGMEAREEFVMTRSIPSLKKKKKKNQGNTDRKLQMSLLLPCLRN